MAGSRSRQGGGRTGPRGGAHPGLNATRHGVLSRRKVLPWEDAGEYAGILDSLTAEHRPRGPTEAHLVEELAGAIWRKRRLEAAEDAAFRDGLAGAAAPLSLGGNRAARTCAVLDGETGGPGEAAFMNIEAQAALSPAGGRAEERAELEDAVAHLDRAIALLRAGGDGARATALAMLDDEARGHVEGQAQFILMDDGELADALETTIRAGYQHLLDTMGRRDALAGHMRALALDPETLGRLARYETHLDRKFERTLAMLMKLQALRALPGANLETGDGSQRDDG